MKNRKSKLFMSILTQLLLCTVMLVAGCEKKENTDYVEGYIVGSFIADEFNADGQATGNKTPRGYCLLLEGSEDNSMSFYSFNFPDDLFSFPNEILLDYNGSNCGPAFFPDSLKYAYKTKFRYQIVDEQDKVLFVTGACTAMSPIFLWENYDQVIVSKTVKN